MLFNLIETILSLQVTQRSGKVQNFLHVVLKAIESKVIFPIAGQPIIKNYISHQSQAHVKINIKYLNPVSVYTHFYHQACL